MPQITKKQDTRAGRGDKILSKVNQLQENLPLQRSILLLFFFFLVESKVDFIMDAGNWGEVQTRVQRPTRSP